MNNLSTTTKYMVSAFVLALIALIPVYNYIYNPDAIWPYILPLKILSITTSYMAIFFHEIGHSIFSWFYGYPTIPTFDFKYGGGFARQLAGQQYIILAAVDVGIIYLIYLFNYYRIIQIALAILIAFHLLTALTYTHQNIINFMGPISVPIIASFFLYRALFNLTVKKNGERFLNAFFGFAFILESVLKGVSLIGNNVYRRIYFEQKGSHGFGDFDKIAQSTTFLSFNGVVSISIIISLICLITPFFLYKRRAIMDNH